MLSALVRFECGRQEAEAVYFRVPQRLGGGEELKVTPSCCLRTRLEKGAAHGPGNPGSRSWLNMAENSSQALDCRRTLGVPGQ